MDIKKEDKMTDVLKEIAKEVKEDFQKIFIADNNELTKLGMITLSMIAISEAIEVLKKGKN